MIGESQMTTADPSTSADPSCQKVHFHETPYDTICVICVRLRRMTKTAASGGLALQRNSPKKSAVGLNHGARRAKD
jgi:hypothetical protein